MRIHSIAVADILVPTNRQRREFDAQALLDLAGSISDNGLIHPIVVRKDVDGQIVLVAGERRLKALDYVWQYDSQVKCGDHVFPPEIVPCLYLGELDPIAAFEIELEENIRRTDLTWKEVATARSQLMQLRSMQNERDGKPPPSVADIMEEVSDGKTTQGGVYYEVRQDLILARHLDNPAIAKATSRVEAIKILKRETQREEYARLGAEIGTSLRSSMHTLLQGNCLEVMPTLPSSSFDIILTDPPYGIGADDFGDSGKALGSHIYDDSPEAWKLLMVGFCLESWRLSKPEAHLYVFCDIDRFHQLKALCEAAGWQVFRTPLVWHNPTAMRAPWPEQGPQRKYQLILYAIKGGRPVTRLYSDVIHCPSDPNLGHAAQKPVALLNDLLRRSARPGDSVLDPFTGTGSIYPACHEAKCRATGIELDAAAFGIASQRIKELDQ